MNPSLTLPPAVARGALEVGELHVERCRAPRAALRSFMIGEQVSFTGATVRPIDRTVSKPSDERSRPDGAPRAIAAGRRPQP